MTEQDPTQLNVALAHVDERLNAIFNIVTAILLDVKTLGERVRTLENQESARGTPAVIEEKMQRLNTRICDLEKWQGRLIGGIAVIVVCAGWAIALIKIFA